MGSHLTNTLTRVEVASGTKTIDVASSTIEMPYADSISFTLSSGAGTGTSPTMDVSMQWTPDDGTTWVQAPIKFAQVTTSASVQMVTFRPNLGDNESAWTNAVATTGSAVAKNFVPSRKIRFYFDMGGTNPSFPTVIIYGAYQNRSV